MNSTRKIIQNTTILYVKTGITVFVSIFFSRYLLEALGIEDYGIFNLVGGVIGMLAFVTATLSNSGTRFIARSLGEHDIEKTRRVFFSVASVTNKIVYFLVIGLEISGILFINFVLKIPPERLLAANIVYQVMIINSVYNVLTAPYAGLLFSREKIVFISTLEIIDIIVKLIISFSLIYFSSDRLIIYAILLMILSIIQRVILKEYCIRTDDIDFRNIDKKLYIDKYEVKSLLSFSGLSLLDSIGIITNRQGAIFLLNYFFGLSINAAYGIASVVNNQLSNLSSSLLKAFQPQIYKSYGEGDFEKQSLLLYLTSKLGLLLLSVVLIPLIFEVDYILDIWLVNVPPFTAIFVRFSMFLTIIGHISYGLTISMLANGRIKELQLTTFILQVLNFPISLLLFKLNYPVYTFYVVSISLELLSFGFRLYYSKRFIKLHACKYILEVVVRPLFMILISFVVNYFVYLKLEPSLFRLFIIGFLNLIIVSSIAYYYVFNLKEREMFKKIVQNLSSHLNIKKKV